MDSEAIRSLRDVIMIYISDAFMEKHLSGNLVNTMKVGGSRYYAKVLIPARRYNMRRFIRTGEIHYYPGDGSYASQLDISGSNVGNVHLGNHVGYVKKAIMQAIPTWAQYEGIEVISVTYD